MRPSIFSKSVFATCFAISAIGLTAAQASPPARFNDLYTCRPDAPEGAAFYTPLQELLIQQQTINETPFDSEVLKVKTTYRATMKVQPSIDETEEVRQYPPCEESSLSLSHSIGAQ